MTAPDHQPAYPPFSRLRLLRLSSFHVGSAMSDILVSSVWNRVMISEFHLPSWPVSLLLAIRYLLVPVSIWAGFISDHHPLWGLHRSLYIWFGRAMMLLSLPCIALSLSCFSGTEMPAVGWLLAVLGFLLYGFGGLMSGSPFIALVRDSTPYEKRGLAMTLVETLMIACFPLAAILFGALMEHYSNADYWRLTIITMAVGGFFWIFSTLGMERSVDSAPSAGNASPETMLASLRSLWGQGNTRFFFLFLAVAALSAWMQDAILEPFGADVFFMSAGKTTRFSAYWMGSTLLTLVCTTIYLRRRPPESLVNVASSGLMVMSLGMLGLAFAAMTVQPDLVTMALVVFGAGFGVYTFAGLNLMMVMTTDSSAGMLLGFWTVAQVVARGLGISLGGILRDVLSTIFGSLPPAYAMVFGIEAFGLSASILLLRAVRIGSGKAVRAAPGVSTPLSEAI